MTARIVRDDPAAAGDGSAHGLRVGVHGQEGGAERRRRAHALRDRVADIVQLEVEKHLLAGRGEAGGERQTARIGELIADLVEADRIPEALDEPFGLRKGGKVEGDDEAVARGQAHEACQGHVRRLW